MWRVRILKTHLKPGSRIVVIVIVISNRKQVKVNSERNLSQLLTLISMGGRGHYGSLIAFP